MADLDMWRAAAPEGQRLVVAAAPMIGNGSRAALRQRSPDRYACQVAAKVAALAATVATIARS